MSTTGHKESESAVVQGSIDAVMLKLDKYRLKLAACTDGETLEILRLMQACGDTLTSLRSATAAL